MNATQVAEVLGVDYRTVIGIIRRGALRADYAGPGLMRRCSNGLWTGQYTINDADFEEFLCVYGYLYNWREVWREPWATIARKANESDPYLNIKEASRVLGYGENATRKRIRRWSVPAVIGLMGSWWLRRSDAERLRDLDRGLFA